MMRGKIITTLAFLLMAVSGAWAESYLYFDISGKSATLKYGEVPTGKPYYKPGVSLEVWEPNEYSGYGYFHDNCTTISVDVSCKDFAGTSLESLFNNFVNLTTINNLGNLNTAGVTSMLSMFYNCSSLTTLDLSGWNTASVTDMKFMFSGCSNLTTICVDGGWSTAGITDGNSYGMFDSCTKLPNWDGTTDKSMAKVLIDGGYLTPTESYLYLDIDGSGTSATMKYGRLPAKCLYYINDGSVIGRGNNGYSQSEYNSIMSYCTTISVDESCQNFAGTNIFHLFYGLTGLTTINSIENLNTAHVTDMSYMFDCSSLTTIDGIGNLNTASVTDMSGMFSGCSSLTTINGIGNLNTANVTNMGSMFSGCSSLTTLNLSGWNTSKVEDMDGMFSGCTNLTTLNLSGWSTDNITTIYLMFENCSSLTTIDGIGNLNTAKVTSMYGMFSGCSSLTTLDLRGWDTSNIDNMGYMFSGCSNLTTLNLSGWNTSSVENMSGMFYGCSSLTTIYIDKNWSTASVTSSNYMFEGCTKLPRWNSTTDASMAKTSIYDGYLTTTEYYLYLDIDDSGTSATLKYGEVPLYKPCYPCYYDSHPQWSGNGSDVFNSFWENGTTINVDVSCKDYAGTTLEMLFFNRPILTTINNLGNLKTDNVTNMKMVFFLCSSLTTLDLSGWNTASITNMENMFSGCSSLTTLDLSGWSTANVTDMYAMFSACENLTTIYVGDGWSTEKATNSDGMFVGCTKLPNWDGTTDATHANTGASGYLNKVKVTANSDGAGNYWATYYNGTHSFKADANTTVYQAKVNGTKDAVKLTEVTSKEIPADKGVVLKSTASSIILSVATTTTTYSDNDLLGTDVALATPANAYCLSNETTGSARGVGFYLYTPSNGATIPAHRAYLVVAGGPSNARGFLGFGDDDNSTGIGLPEAAVIEADGPVYDLSGRRVAGQPVKGIYVKNGKKLIIK